MKKNYCTFCLDFSLPTICGHFCSLEIRIFFYLICIFIQNHDTIFITIKFTNYSIFTSDNFKNIYSFKIYAIHIHDEVMQKNYYLSVSKSFE